MMMRGRGRAGNGCFVRWAVAVDLSAMIAMSAVTVKQMHQRTGQQQKERENAEKMGPVFGQQKERADREKTDQYPVAATAMPGWVVLVFMVKWHGDLL
jgi:hypothetical protein